MHHRWHAEELPLVPAELAGLGLVVLAGLVLAGGLSVGPGTAPAVGGWVLAAGLLLLLGAALATVLLGAAASPRPAGDRAGAVGSPRRLDYPILDAGSEATEYGRAPPAAGGFRPGPAPASTSIPGAYLAAVTASGEVDAPDWESSPPIAAALPLAALWPAPGPRAAGGDAETSALLEVELARLRARLREIEASAPSPPSAAPRLDVSGGRRGARLGATFDAPGRPDPRPVDRRSCTSCGRPVPGTASATLCTSCGGFLCATCLPECRGAGGLLTCPTCASRRRSEAISGGRAAPSAGGGAAPREPAAPVPRG